MIIEEIKKRVKEDIKTIILPEATDLRVLEAASIAISEHIANIILIGNKDEIENLALNNNINIDDCIIINPLNYDMTPKFIEQLYELRKDKGLKYNDVENLIKNDYMYFATMMLHNNLADGVVSGAIHSSANTLRPALQIIKTKQNMKLVSAFFLMEVPNCNYGFNGTFVFADAGLVQNPNSIELADIAYSSANSFENLTQQEATVALLSHSTKGSAKHSDVTKVIDALNIAKEKYQNLNIDGELQLDAAIDKSVASIKAPNSSVAGNANVLIFPDLDAGNIGYKLVERLANAKAYGPITQGLNKPINDLSRGSSIEDIVGVIAITALQAQQK